MANYFDMVKADVLEWVTENRELLPKNFSLDDNVMKLYDMLWCDDSVTGNASGSYTCNAYKAKEYVFGDINAVLYGLEEFCVENKTIGQKFMEGNWEWFDMIARLGQLYRACEEVLEELGE